MISNRLDHFIALNISREAAKIIIRCIHFLHRPPPMTLNEHGVITVSVLVGREDFDYTVSQSDEGTGAL